MQTTSASLLPRPASPAAAGAQGTGSGSAGAGTGGPNFTYGEEDRSQGFNEFRQSHGLNDADESAMKTFKLGLFQGFLAAELERRTKTKDLTVTAEGTTDTKPGLPYPSNKGSGAGNPTTTLHTTLPQGARPIGKQIGKAANKALEVALNMGMEQGRKMFERATGLDEPELKKVRALLSKTDANAVNQALAGNNALLKALLPNAEISGLQISSSAPASNSNAQPTPSSQAIPGPSGPFRGRTEFPLMPTRPS